MHEWNLLFFFLFFIFFLLKWNDSITIHMSEKEFDWKGRKYFIQKDGWHMYAWLSMMYEIPYVWISFAFFLKQIRIVPHFIFILNSWNHSTLIFFSNHFFGLISLLTNTFFLIISFETLFEWYPWNCQGLEKAWMRWWRLTRELP